MAFDLAELEGRLRVAADELRANSTLKASEYSVPVLGLIFLKFAEVRFLKAERELATATQTGHRTRLRCGGLDWPTSRTNECATVWLPHSRWPRT
jgi:type I restriction enzyme M protein